MSIPWAQPFITFLTGQPPFRGTTLAILRQVNEKQPLPPRQINDKISRDLENICLKALEKELGQRYRSVKEFADDLEPTLQGRPVSARSLSSAKRVMRWARTHKTLATVLSLLFGSMLGGNVGRTTLWRLSNHQAKAADQCNVDLQANKQLLWENQERLQQNQERLPVSVRTMVSNSFSRKSTYLEMSGDDRILAAHSLLETSQTIYVGDPDKQQAIREIATDLTQATETLLDLGMYHVVF